MLVKLHLSQAQLRSAQAGKNIRVAHSHIGVPSGVEVELSPDMAKKLQRAYAKKKGVQLSGGSFRLSGSGFLSNAFGAASDVSGRFGFGVDGSGFLSNAFGAASDVARRFGGGFKEDVISALKPVASVAVDSLLAHGRKKIKDLAGVGMTSDASFLPKELDEIKANELAQRGRHASADLAVASANPPKKRGRPRKSGSGGDPYWKNPGVVSHYQGKGLREDILSALKPVASAGTDILFKAGRDQIKKHTGVGVKLVKGSQEAKDHMARLRAMRKK